MKSNIVNVFSYYIDDVRVNWCQTCNLHQFDADTLIPTIKYGINYKNKNLLLDH